MPYPHIQIPSGPLLPRAWSLGTETEFIADLLTHVSTEVSVAFLHEKIVHILATEVVVVPGVPGNLWIWVEVSPYLTTTTGAYWAAIGGGGGALPPMTPVIEVAAGVNLRAHTLIIPFNIHAPFIRVVVQTPVAAALPGAFWAVQLQPSGKSE